MQGRGGRRAREHSPQWTAVLGWPLQGRREGSRRGRGPRWVSHRRDRQAEPGPRTSGSPGGWSPLVASMLPTCPACGPPHPAQLLSRSVLSCWAQRRVPSGKGLRGVVQDTLPARGISPRPGSPRECQGQVRPRPVPAHPTRPRHLPGSTLSAATRRAHSDLHFAMPNGPLCSLSGTPLLLSRGTCPPSSRELSGGARPCPVCGPPPRAPSARVPPCPVPGWPAQGMGGDPHVARPTLSPGSGRGSGRGPREPSKSPPALCEGKPQTQRRPGPREEDAHHAGPGSGQQVGEVAPTPSGCLGGGCSGPQVGLRTGHLGCTVLSAAGCPSLLPPSQLPWPVMLQALQAKPLFTGMRGMVRFLGGSPGLATAASASYSRSGRLLQSTAGLAGLPLEGPAGCGEGHWPADTLRAGGAGGCCGLAHPALWPRLPHARRPGSPSPTWGFV